MATYRASITFTVDTTLPRDGMVITPHYTGSDPSLLATALKTNLQGVSTIGFTKPFRVDIYDVAGPPPHHPLATATATGGAPGSPGPREVNLCLSYFASVNQPRKRGRLYIPLVYAGGTAGLRPTLAQRNAVMEFGPALGHSLPPGHVWVVWSKRDNTARPVTDYWVDDEWDTVRSRGTKPTTRSTGTI